MEPLLINTKQTGGAAIACRRLLKGLINQNVRANLLLRDKLFDEPNTHGFDKNTPYIRFIRYKKRIYKKLGLMSREDEFLFSRSQKGLEYYSYPTSEFDITTSGYYPEASIINLHWVAGFLDYPSFFKKNKKPVVWTLHDMNPFTGGEHISEKYLGIDSKGFPVTREKSKQEIIEDNKNLMLKMEAFEYVDNLVVVSPSKWLANEAKQSVLFESRRVIHIPNGLDENVFSPRDKKFSRDLLGLPENAIIILFVADTISRQLKGFGYLVRALESINNPDVVLCAVGTKPAIEKSKIRIKYFGQIQDELMMSLIYSAADVFIIPSLMENLPNTTLEAQMCGTPVIGFSVGGIVDVVEDKRTGFLCPEISTEALTHHINLFIQQFELFDRQYIRRQAVSKYSLDVQAKEYVKLFNSL